MHTNGFTKAGLVVVCQSKAVSATTFRDLVFDNTVMGTIQVA